MSPHSQNYAKNFPLSRKFKLDSSPSVREDDDGGGRSMGEECGRSVWLAVRWTPKRTLHPGMLIARTSFSYLDVLFSIRKILWSLWDIPWSRGRRQAGRNAIDLASQHQQTKWRPWNAIASRECCTKWERSLSNSIFN